MSPRRSLVILGAGGFGRGVHDVVDAINRVHPTWHVLGYLDDSPDRHSLECAKRREATILGPLSALDSILPGSEAVIGISDPRLRRMLDSKLTNSHLKSATLIHPAATVTDSAEIGAGSVICAGVRLASNVRLGRHVHLNMNCTAGHDAVMGNYVSLFPQAALSGFSIMRDDSTLGSHAVVLPNVSVGAGATVGAGSVVARDVIDNNVVKGVPAK